VSEVTVWLMSDVELRRLEVLRDLQSLGTPLSRYLHCLSSGMLRNARGCWVLGCAAGAEPSPAFSSALVFEQPILRLEHREELPSLGGRIFKFANEPLLVTFELVKMRGKGTELAIDSLFMRSRAVTRARSRNTVTSSTSTVEIGARIDTQQFACVEAETAIIEAFCGKSTLANGTPDRGA
jgi:hypothetical protein